MYVTNGHSVGKETWDSHNKMMQEPLSVSDSEVCLRAIVEFMFFVSGTCELLLSIVVDALLWRLCFRCSPS